MKLIVAIIRPNKLEDVREALLKVGEFGVTITQVRGFGKQQGHIDAFDLKCSFLPKEKLEIAVKDSEVKKVIAAVKKAAFTGENGDGKIFVLPLEDVVRIRTSQSGEDAL